MNLLKIFKLYYKLRVVPLLLVGIFLISSSFNQFSSTEVIMGTTCPSCVNFRLFVFLEGAFDNEAGEMTTLLNSDSRGNLFHRGLLPGQTPLSPMAIPTPPGQPYSSPPWNYVGTSLENSFAGPYHADVTDWVLVSLRSTIHSGSEFFKAAGLLYKDGRIELIEPCSLQLGGTTPTQGYVSIQHRNHIGIGSPYAVDFSSGILDMDFRIQQSYVTSAGFGQKRINPFTYAMYAGDGDQVSDVFSYDITGNDNILWNLENGRFDNYSLSDFNLDGDINAMDKILWSVNNGISSRWHK